MKLFVDALLIVLLFGYTSCTKAKRNKGEFHRSSSTVIIRKPPIKYPLSLYL